MTGVYTELALVSLAAMVSPTTLSFTVLALVLGERPLRTGFWFFVGAFGVTLLIGVLAALVLGNVAASPDSSNPKTWVSVFDIVAGVALLIFVIRSIRRPANPERIAGMIEQMGRVASSPVIAIIAAGATLANPGGFIPVALKDISQTNPSTSQYVVLWLCFALVSLLPLLLAILMLIVAPARTKTALLGTRGWLENHARTLASVILALLAATLIRNGVAGLT
jgi:membrane-associated protease RseP (regulator of RpoE activity)